jgi:hypothetical protein
MHKAFDKSTDRLHGFQWGHIPSTAMLHIGQRVSNRLRG